METSNSDLQVIRQMLADLTARVYRIERRLQMDVPVQQQPSVAVESAVPVIPAEASPAPPKPSVAGSPPQIPPRVPYVVSAPANISPRVPYTKSDSDLESRIGSHWLNRIGIAALLIGVSYFLKFAFDNNWIGPAGRVTIGLLAGIAMVVWSERFRSKVTRRFPIRSKRWASARCICRCGLRFRSTA